MTEEEIRAILKSSRLTPSQGYALSRELNSNREGGGKNEPYIIPNASSDDKKNLFTTIPNFEFMGSNSNNLIEVSDSKKKSIEDAPNNVSFQSLLESVIGKPQQQKSSEPDAYTQAIQAANPLKMLMDGVTSIASEASRRVQNALDVGSYLPLPENPVTKQLLLDHAVAAQTQSDVVKQITAAPSSAPDIPPSFDPTDIINRELSAGTFIGRTTGPEPTDFPNKTAIASPPLSARAKHMLSSFEGSFPDKKFTVSEEGGVITVKDVQPTASQVVSVVPLNHNVDTAATGLKDLTRQLQVPELPDKDRLALAFDLAARAATQSAAMFPQYERQANAEQGIPDLTQQLATSRQLDLRSPHVMSQGGLSAETAALQEELARARTVAGSRVSQMMREDPIINEAETIAKTTIAKLQTLAGYDAKTDADIVRDQKRAQYDALISQYKDDPSLLNRVALMKTGKPLPPIAGADVVMATQLANKAIHFDKDEEAIIGMPKETLNGQYLLVDPKNEVMKVKMKNVMLWEEANSLRGKVPAGQEAAIALGHFKLWQSKVDRPLNRDGGVPDALLSEYNKEDAGLKMRYTGTELAKQQHILAIQYKLKMLDDTVRSTQFADVRSWGGAFQSDLTTQAVLKQYQSSAPGKPFPSKEFVTAYMNYNDGANKADKVTKLRSMVIDSVNAMPDSIFFPKPNPESFAAAVDKQIVGGFMQQILPYLTGTGPHGFIPGVGGLVQGAAAVAGSR